MWVVHAKSSQEEHKNEMCETFLAKNECDPFLTRVLPSMKPPAAERH